MILHGGSVSWQGETLPCPEGYYGAANYGDFARWSWHGNRHCAQRAGYELPGNLEWRIYGMYL